MDQRSLREAIASAQAGRASGYEALLEAYGPRLHGFFFRATGSSHDAEDLLGELTLRLLRRLKDYRHRERFEAWLFRIAANLVRDHVRRRARHSGRVSLSARDEQGRCLAERLAGRDRPVQTRLLRDEQVAGLQAALEQLDLPTREVILLRHFGQMRFREIAEATGRPLGTVLARAHRGLKELRRTMEAADGVA